jgi:hypothetical protein
MITFDDAKIVALKELREREKRSKKDLALLEDETIEFESGWMFFYQSVKGLKTGNFLYMLGGNSPMIVDKMNGTLHTTGTRKPNEFYIEKYNQYRDNPEVYYKEINT